MCHLNKRTDIKLIFVSILIENKTNKKHSFYINWFIDSFLMNIIIINFHTFSIIIFTIYIYINQVSLL